eukprot:g27828.t1
MTSENVEGVERLLSFPSPPLQQRSHRRRFTVVDMTDEEVTDSAFGTDWKRFVIMFDRYETQDALRSRLTSILGRALDDDYSIVKRPNAIAGLETDFLVVMLREEKGILDILRAHEGVKAVVEDKLLPEPSKEEVVEDSSSSEFSDMTVNGTSRVQARRKLLNANALTQLTGATQLWADNIKGQGIKLAIFDSGLDGSNQYLKHVKDRTSWVGSSDPRDEVGHGTAVAGIAAGTHPDCLGMAPEAHIYAYKIFNRQRMTYTSWYLDAVNHAIKTRVDVANLSLGGPDWNDYVFVAKSREVSANGIVLVSAIGNDGPTYGTLYNPGDQTDAIGVGSVNWDNSIANFQSRGMTIWELPDGGYGRIKPDIVTFGAQIRSVRGSRCGAMSGTSASSPVVAGAVCLLASAIPQSKRSHLLNPAVLKQVLVETAKPVQNAHIHEQGSGKMDLPAAYRALLRYELHASVIPGELDLTECPRVWPYCKSPLYYTRQPLMLNLTITNPASVSGFLTDFAVRVDQPVWEGLLQISHHVPPKIWPYATHLGLLITTTRDVQADVVVSGELRLVVRPELPADDVRLKDYPVRVPFKLRVIPTPPKAQRLLWDQVHNRGYPGGFIPNDQHSKAHSLDLSGDHIHTNFRHFFNWATQKGFYVEVLSKTWNGQDLSQYGALLLLDPEADFLPDEIAALSTHIKNGLSVLVMAGWYALDAVNGLIFFDDETQTYWYPKTGGCNVPALNELLEPYGIGFGDQVFKSQGRSQLGFSAGAAIRKFPQGGRLCFSSVVSTANKRQKSNGDLPIAGLVEAHVLATRLGGDPRTCGRIVVHGDSSCAEGQGSLCTEFLEQALDYLVGKLDARSMRSFTEVTTEYLSANMAAPQRASWAPRNYDPHQSIGPPRPDPLVRPPARTSQSTDGGGAAAANRSDTSAVDITPPPPQDFRGAQVRRASPANRRVLIGAGWLVTLFVLCYAVMRWRNRRAKSTVGASGKARDEPAQPTKAAVSPVDRQEELLSRRREKREEAIDKNARNRSVTPKARKQKPWVTKWLRIFHTLSFWQIKFEISKKMGRIDLRVARVLTALSCMRALVLLSRLKGSSIPLK